MIKRKQTSEYGATVSAPEKQLMSACMSMPIFVVSMSTGTLLMCFDEWRSSLRRIFLKIYCLPFKYFCMRSVRVDAFRKLTMATASMYF